MHTADVSPSDDVHAAEPPLPVAGARAAAVLAALLSFAVFAPAARFGLVNFDDWAYVGDPHVVAGLTLDGVGWAFSTWTQANWHPLTWLSYMADVTLLGGGPAVHHLVNASLHAAVVAVVAVLVAGVGGRAAVALIAALWWGVHPLRVESVVWVSERKDVLCALFYLLAVVVWVRFLRHGRSSDRALLWICATLAMLAKPMAVTLPAVLPLVAWWPVAVQARATGGSAVRPRAGVVAWAPVALGAVGLALVTLGAQQPAIDTGEVLAPAARLGNLVVALARYGEDLVAPRDLAVLYGLPRGGWPASIVVIAVLVVFVAVVASALPWLRRRERAWIACTLWFLVVLAPVAGIIQIGVAARADRYTYLPSVGAAVALGLGLERVWARRARVLAPGSAAILAMLAAVSVAQSSVWSRSWDLFAHTVAVEPDNAIAHGYLAGIALASRELAIAEEEARTGVALRPDDAFVRLMLGRVLARGGRHAEATVELREATRAAPRHTDAWLYLAASALAVGDADAEDALATARALGGGDAKAHRAVGLALLTEGRRVDAEPHLWQATRGLPADATLRATVREHFCAAGMPAQSLCMELPAQ